MGSKHIFIFWSCIRVECEISCKLNTLNIVAKVFLNSLTVVKM